MLVAYWLGFRKIKSWQAHQVFEVHPSSLALTRRQLVQVVSSGSLSTRTGGCHCRGGGQGGLPPRTRASRTSPSALARGVEPEKTGKKGSFGPQKAPFGGSGFSR